MNIGITRAQHGIADYVYAPLVWMAPKMVGFGRQPQATLACKVAAASAATYALFTDAEWGVAKVIPYKAHLGIDLGVGVLSAAAPWLLGFAKNKRARNTFLVMSAVTFAVGVLSVLGNQKD